MNLKDPFKAFVLIAFFTGGKFSICLLYEITYLKISLLAFLMSSQRFLWEYTFFNQLWSTDVYI